MNSNIIPLTEYLDELYRSTLLIDVSTNSYDLKIKKIIEVYDLAFAKYQQQKIYSHNSKTRTLAQLETLMGACLAELNHYHAEKSKQFTEWIKVMLDECISTQENTLNHLKSIKQSI